MDRREHALRSVLLDALGAAGNDGAGAPRAAGAGPGGRPLSTPVGPLTAPVTTRPDWADGGIALSPPARLRPALAEHWRETAAAEHAAVGSYARFTLELLHFGAPPELLLDAQHAAADKVRHAEIAFSFASTLCGEPVGPGALPLAPVALTTELDTFVRRVVEEGCIGETLAVARLQQAREQATDPMLLEAVDGLLRDETRHAALGWKTLAWLVRIHPELTSQLPGLFDAAEQRLVCARFRSTVVAPDWGLWSAEEQRATAEAAFRGAVRPCLDAVIGTVQAPVAEA